MAKCQREFYSAPDVFYSILHNTSYLPFYCGSDWALSSAPRRYNSVSNSWRPTCGLADGKPSGIPRQPLAVAPVPAFLVRQPQWGPRRLITVATDNTQPEPLRLDSL